MTGLPHPRSSHRLRGRLLLRGWDMSQRPFLLLHLVSWTRFALSYYGSALRPLIVRATTASADFCGSFRLPVGRRSRHRHPRRSPRVLRTCFHAYACRIYASTCWADFGLQICWLPCPVHAPRMRFLFVRPAFCLGLPSHGALRSRSCLWL